MCPLWPAHYILLYICVIGPLWLLSWQIVGAAATLASKNNDWDVKFSPSDSQTLIIGQTNPLKVSFNGTQLAEQAENGLVALDFLIENTDLASVQPEKMILNTSEIALSKDKSEKSFNVSLHGVFLGRTSMSIKRVDQTTENVFNTAPLPLKIIRKSGLLDSIFTYSVIALVAIIYINMGAALDTRIITATLKRPIGPAIGFFSQFVIMPVLSYVIAKSFLPDPALQLGLFITGCSPAGGASNIWTLTCGGNLDLSITMTTVSTFSAFVMMPLWILTLGATILREANLSIPYRNIASFAVGLVVPLAIGISIQRFFPKVAKWLVRALKPFSVFLIVYIVVFAIVTNLYLFRLFQWQIIVCGILLPWLGYILGGGAAWLFQQEWRDILAIGIETGVQNTGLAILALRISLPAPESDLTTVLPVSVAIFTPVLPIVILIVQKILGIKNGKQEKTELLYNVSTPQTETPLATVS